MHVFFIVPPGIVKLRSGSHLDSNGKTRENRGTHLKTLSQECTGLYAKSLLRQQQNGRGKPVLKGSKAEAVKTIAHCLERIT